MNSRLLEIVKYKTGGKQAEFSRLLGWTPQYLAKLLGGGNFGLPPVLTLLESFPEVDALWCLFGKGEMLTDHKVSGIKREVLSSVQRVLDLERFMPVMFPAELQEFEEAFAEGRFPSFSYEKVMEVEPRLRAKTEQEDACFREDLKNSKL